MTNECWPNGQSSLYFLECVFLWSWRAMLEVFSKSNSYVSTIHVIWYIIEQYPISLDGRGY